MIEGKKILYVIPARGGSKGVPGKNIKLLHGRPLIYYAIDVALLLAANEDICVSTDDESIKNVVEQAGLKVPFLRPKELASDKAGMYEVLLHALNYFLDEGRNYDLLVLLQPTSPFRTAEHVREAFEIWKPGVEMVVSVKETKANPYYNLMEEDEDGWLFKSKSSSTFRRQDSPKVYELNGAIYIINVQSLKKGPLSSFKRIRKYIMDEISSIDIDTPLNWLFAESVGAKYFTI